MAPVLWRPHQGVGALLVPRVIYDPSAEQSLSALHPFTDAAGMVEAGM
jgi:hypothetical protein